MKKSTLNVKEKSFVQFDDQSDGQFLPILVGPEGVGENVWVFKG